MITTDNKNNEGFNESILIDISLNSNSYNTMSNTDLVTPRENRKSCCSCCLILTISSITTIITFTVLFFTDIFKKS